MKKFYLLSLLMLLPLMASADPVLINGIYYNLNSSDQTAEVTQQDFNSGRYYSGEVIIPETVTHENVTYSVTSVGVRAFVYCRGLTSVTIPNSVISIGIQAFEQSGITSVIIGSNVKTIASNAFSSCRGLTLLVIPNSVTSIGQGAFGGCSGLTSLSIGSGVATIGENAFSSGAGLTSIVVDEGNTTYDSRNNCNALIEKSTNTLILGCKNTTIPNSVTTIGNFAFSGCGLTSLAIPSSVTTIGKSAFSGCSGLTSLSIGSGVTSIGSGAFSGCNNVTTIVVEDGNTAYDSRNNCNAIIEKATNTLIAGCNNSTIPNSVTTIGNSAFNNCDGLTSVTIPNSVTTIGDGAFSGCGLTSLAIPSSVITIGESAFSGCTGLTSISIGSGVTTIGSRAFAGCSNVTTIVVEDGNTAYDSRNNCNAIIEKATNTLIAGCKNSTIPDGVTAIGNAAFSQCTGLTSVTIPNSVTTIGNGAFGNCDGLTSVTIPNRVTTIEGIAFVNCHNLTSIVIPNSVATIRYQAFYSCDKVTSLTLGSGIKEIDWLAFGDMPSLTDIYCYAENVPKADEDHATPYMVFDEYKATLHVPAGSVDAYKAAEPWKNFKEIVGVPQHSLVYKVDGEVYKSYQICEGASITPEAEPTKDGYDFSGWSTIPATMPAEDVTVTGTFTLKSDVDVIKISSAGQSTWCSKYDLDFTGVEGVKAYIASGYNRTTGTIWLTRVNEVPANEGILIIGKVGDCKVPHKSTTTYYANLMVGTLNAITINEKDGDYTNYYLSNGDYGVGFYKVNGTQALAANRAYLPLLKDNVPAGTRYIGLGFDDGEGTTGINGIKSEGMKDDAYYTLQGQRVMNPGKGLYIKNGKKVVIR